MGAPKPTASIDLGDGILRTASFDFAAAWWFEEQTGIPMSELGAENGAANLSFKATAYLVTAMLRDDDPQVSAEHVAKHLHMGNMEEVMNQINSLMGASTASTTREHQQGEETEAAPSG